MQWKIAAMCLITLPVAIWLLVQWPNSFSPMPTIALAMLPLGIGVGLELYARAMSNKPDPYAGGSVVGNKLAIGLAISLVCMVLFFAYRVVTHQPN